ncbi:MAG TPA: hypothetical protein VGR73_15545 [Bryobacteraceae bacterium]|nr:hypothetical protein [Bryobacteraceae bacterium]
MWIFLLWLAAAPFWQEKPPAEWNDIQLAQFLNDSPWAHAAVGTGKVQGPPVQTYLVSARPMEQAERERNRRVALRRKPGSEDVLGEEYRAWFEDNRAGQVMLAVRVGTPPAFSDESEIRKMQENCALRSGRVRVKMSSYFPPSMNDPYLHLAFPRNAVVESEKYLDFELYLPGISGPFRAVEFVLHDLAVDGRLEY